MSGCGPEDTFLRGGEDFGATRRKQGNWGYEIQVLSVTIASGNSCTFSALSGMVAQHGQLQSAAVL